MTDSAQKETHGSSGSSRRFATGVVVSVLVVLVMLLIGEFSVRMIYGHRMNLFPRFHTGTDYDGVYLRSLRPDSRFEHTSPDGIWGFVTNNRGFRDTADYYYDKPDTILRIISLGDSQVQGFEVSQDSTFSEVLQRESIAVDMRSEGLNCGISGFGTAEALAFFKNEGVKYQPDVVVLGFFANDFEDNIRCGLYRLVNDSIVRQSDRYLPGVELQDRLLSNSLFTWLIQNSYLFSLTVNLITGSDADLERALPTKEPTVDQIDLTIKLVGELFRECERDSIRFVFIDIPVPTTNGYRPSISPEIQERMSQLSHVYIDAAILFDASDDSLFFRPNGLHHLNNTGHQIIGAAIADSIIDSEHQ